MFRSAFLLLGHRALLYYAKFASGKLRALRSAVATGAKEEVPPLTGWRGGWEYGNSGIPGTTFITVLKVPWFFEGRFAVCEGHSWKLYLLDSRGKSEAVTDFYPPPLLFF